MRRTEFNPAKLGAFVVGALLLAVAAIILWGPLNGLWEKRYVIFFDETATGLDDRGDGANERSGHRQGVFDRSLL